MRFYFLSLCMLSACATAAESRPATSKLPAATECKAGAKFNDPAAPLHIYGNTWYVGTCGVSSILLTSPKGHVLIDGDTEQAAPLIEANIRRLGFRVNDVRYILNSHEHFDHAGGIAQLQRHSAAVVMARAPAAAAIEHGRGDRSDPQFLTADAFPPATSVHRIADGELLRLGPIALTAHATPGHTPGSTSWTWESCEKSRCQHMVYADSLTAVSDDVYRYSDETQHPGVVAAFRQSIATISALPCDILITPHPDASDLWAGLGAQASSPLIDGDACRRYAAHAGEKLDARIAKENAGAAQ